MGLPQHVQYAPQTESMYFKTTDSPKCPYSVFQLEASVLRLCKVFLCKTYMQPIIPNHNVALQNRKAPSPLLLFQKKRLARKLVNASELCLIYWCYMIVCTGTCIFSHISMPFGPTNLSNQSVQFISALVWVICLSHLLIMCFTGDASYPYAPV